MKKNELGYSFNEVFQHQHQELQNSYKKLKLIKNETRTRKEKGVDRVRTKVDYDFYCDYDSTICNH